MVTTLNRAHIFANGEDEKKKSCYNSLAFNSQIDKLIKVDTLRERRSNQERHQRKLGPQCHTKFENGEVAKIEKYLMINREKKKGIKLKTSKMTLTYQH